MGPSLAGCQLSSSLEDLAGELGNPKNTTAESPGKLLTVTDKKSPLYAEDYRQIGFDGNNADGAYVVAISNDNRAMLLPYTKRAKEVTADSKQSVGGKGCTLGSVAAVGAAQSRSDAREAVFDAKIPFLAAGEMGSTLRFSDFACNLADVELVGASMPLAQFGPAPGYIVQDDMGRLWFVNPWEDHKDEITSNAASITRSGRALFTKGPTGATWMWTLEGGELVGRDGSLEEIFRGGRDIAGILPAYAGTDKMRFLYVDANQGAFTFTAADPTEIEQIAEGACEVRLNEGTKGLEALFLSCADRTFKRYSFDSKETTDLIPAISGYRIMGNVESGPVMLYLKDVDPATRVGPLWAQWGTNNPLFLGDGGHLDMSWINADGRRRPIVNWKDGKGGDLLIGAPDTKPGKEQKLASGVVTFTSNWIVSDYDGTNGKLQWFEDNQLTEVAPAVTPQGLLIDRELQRALCIANYDDESGQLLLVDGLEARPMSKDVAPGPYQFTQQLDTVTALAGPDSELRLHRTDTESELTINTGVSLVLEVAWPDEGFLYSAPGADKPGLYFAKFIP